MICSGPRYFPPCFPHRTACTCRFPRPVHHRIPNFVNADRAADRLAQLPEFVAARTVKVNPDTPQKRVRRRWQIEDDVTGSTIPSNAYGLRTACLLCAGAVARPERRQAAPQPPATTPHRLLLLSQQVQLPGRCHHGGVLFRQVPLKTLGGALRSPACMRALYPVCQCPACMRAL